MHRLNDLLVVLKTQMKEKERLENLLQRAKDLVKILQFEKKELYQKLQKENLDVEQLDGMSIANLFHTILGNKAACLEKEKQEVLSAKLKYDATCEQLANVEAEVLDLQRQLNDFWDLEARYEQFIEEKEAQLMTTSAETASLLDSLADRKATLLHYRRELREAIHAGDLLFDSLQQVRENLKSASNWGTLDMLGGGLISTAVKHSKMDEAKQKITRCQSLLDKFHRELRDVGRMIEAGDLEIGGFLSFADYFFDGILADWSVQSRIHGAQDKVEKTIARVEEILRNLHLQLAQTDQTEEQVERERLAIIEKA